MLYYMVMRKGLTEKDTCRECGGLSGWSQSYREGFQSEGAGRVKTHFFFLCPGRYITILLKWRGFPSSQGQLMK